MIKYIIASAAASLLLSGCSLSGNATSVSPANDINQSNVPEYVDADSLLDVLNGEWTIIAVGSQKIERDDDMPYIFFEANELNFYASNGCNYFNGSFTLDGDKMTFSNIIGTLAYCPDEISILPKENVPYTVSYEKIGSEGYVNISEGQRLLLKLRRHAMGFLNGNWQVVEINGEAVNDDEMTVFFDIPELKVHGNTGCNFFNGNILIEASKANAISFSNMGVTKRMCPKADQEIKMLVALEETTQAFADNFDTALLTNDTKTSTIKLKRLAFQEETENND